MQFILNDKEINTSVPPGTLLLDFIRYHQHLTGTKIGCREGDCGACSILIGEIKNNQLQYRSTTSCLTAIGNIEGKHIVTIEGINLARLNPIQEAMCNENATQCGFCTPGFVVSLAGFCLSEQQPTYENAIAAIDGNICRCTGYKSIERATKQVATLMQQKNGENTINFVTKNNILPQYFSGIAERLKAIAEKKDKEVNNNNTQKKFLGGGTDLYVQQHDTMHHEKINFLFNNTSLKGVEKQGNKCFIGASATVSDLIDSKVIQEYFPQFTKFTKLVSSTPIRNIATIAGNLINASPIGDFTIFFLALNAQIIFSDGTTKRELPLRKLYKGYKTLDKKPDEFIEKIWFELPDPHTKVHFEKVSKRTHLDIASVNTAICINLNKDIIVDASLSAGGVGPIPIFLAETSDFLKGKTVNETIIQKTLEIAGTEISPMSDARGTAIYKQTLLQQLIKAHFITLFPNLSVDTILA